VLHPPHLPIANPGAMHDSKTCRVTCFQKPLLNRDCDFFRKSCDEKSAEANRGAVLYKRSRLVRSNDF
jgi:hypothetical protein